MPFDSVSFGAKIPKNVIYEAKYLPLMNSDPDNTKTVSTLSASTNPEVLTLLYELKSDENVSPEFKRRVLLSDNNCALLYRIQAPSPDKEFHSRVARAILEAADTETGNKLLLAKEYAYSNCTALHYADANEAEFLIGASGDIETEQQQVCKASVFKDADKNKIRAILIASSPETRRMILASPEILFSTNVEILYEFIKDEQEKLEFLGQTHEYSGDNLLHFKESDELDFLLGELKNYPTLLKTLLLQKIIWDKFRYSLIRIEKKYFLLHRMIKLFWRNYYSP